MDNNKSVPDLSQIKRAFTLYELEDGYVIKTDNGDTGDWLEIKSPNAFKKVMAHLMQYLD